MKKEIIYSIFEKIKAKDFGESMCDETKLKILKWCDKQLHKHIVSNNEVAVCKSNSATWNADLGIMICDECGNSHPLQTDC